MPDDTWTTYAIFRRSLADLLTRQGQSWPWVEQDEAEWLQWRPLFEHMEATADQAWGAELDGILVGYAFSIRRADTRELTEFFTLPEAQGRGVGRGLLERALPAADVGHRSIVATSDPAVLAQYLRHGFRASTPLYAFGGRPDRPLPLPADLVVRPLAELPAEDRLAILAAIDGVILGARRDATMPGWAHAVRAGSWSVARDRSDMRTAGHARAPSPRWTLPTCRPPSPWWKGMPWLGATSRYR